MTLTQFTDAELGTWLRGILRDTPDFQVFALQHSPMYVEVSTVYTADLTVDKMEKIRQSLRQIAAMQTVINKDKS
jgi:hypothetical protein